MKIIIVAVLCVLLTSCNQVRSIDKCQSAAYALEAMIVAKRAGTISAHQLQQAADIYTLVTLPFCPAQKDVLDEAKAELSN